LFVKNKQFWSYHLDVSQNSGTPKSSILIGFSIINHPFWGIPIFGNTQVKQKTIPNPKGAGLTWFRKRSAWSKLFSATTKEGSFLDPGNPRTVGELL